MGFVVLRLKWGLRHGTWGQAWACHRAQESAGTRSHPGTLRQRCPLRRKRRRDFQRWKPLLRINLVLKPNVLVSRAISQENSDAYWIQRNSIQVAYALRPFSQASSLIFSVTINGIIWSQNPKNHPPVLPFCHFCCPLGPVLLPPTVTPHVTILSPQLQLVAMTGL